MSFTVFLLSIYVFFKTIGYAIFEYRDNSNKSGAIFIAVLSIIALVRSHFSYFYLNYIELFSINVINSNVNKTSRFGVPYI